MKRRLLLLALAGAVACGESTTTIGVGLAEPSAVVAFRGYTAKYPGQLHPYLAIANAARGDLTLVDAADDTPVLAPVIVRSLAVPVPDPRPALLVASPLFDGGADLLVVASAGAAALQLVETWAQSARIVDEAELAALAPGASILAAVAMPVPSADAAAPEPVETGRVRVAVALTGARLAVVDYARRPDGGIARGDTVLIPLAAEGAPFDAVSLAVNPADPLHLYAASPDPIGSVEGVAELTVAGAPAGWTVRGISARAPTRFVAAARLRERAADWPAPPTGTYDDTTEFKAAPVDRVYAVVDPARCGTRHRIGCGIAVLDPVAGGIIPDYAGLMPYLAPIGLPEIALGLGVSGPPAVRAPGEVLPSDFMTIAPGSGRRATTAVAAVPAGDGRVYWADLGRYAIPNDRSILRANTRTRVQSGTALGVTIVGSDVLRTLGVWYRSDTGWDLAFDTAEIKEGVRVTPGFTTSETWRIAFQAPLPGLEAHRARAGRTLDGRTWVAMQVPASGPGGTTITQVVRLYDPTFGARAGDILELYAPLVAGCPTDANVEARIVEFLPPEEAHPGGAVVLEPLEDPRPADGSAGPRADWPACVAALGASGQGFQAGIRSAGVVALGTSSGYVGRPAVVRRSDVETAGDFELRYEDEDALEAQCPLLPWPDDWRAAPAEFRACDDACRLLCERLVLARKSRRIYHVSDKCFVADDLECNTTWPSSRYPFPRANGPVVALQVGYRGAQDEGDVLPADDQALWGLLRGMLLSVTTDSGLSPSSRIPTTPATATAAVLPSGVATFDRSVVPGKEAEGYRFLVPYANDFVLDFSPSEPVNVAKVIR